MRAAAILSICLAAACADKGEDGGWVADRDISAPELAWAVGVVDESPGYIGNVIDDDQQDAFFLFEAGDSFEIELHVQNATNEFEFIHLHAVDGGALGEELVPNDEDVQSNGLTGWWDIEAGQQYFFEVRVPGGGFF